ncbi:BF3164 family lipoprotein [Algoriphagus yeomjeoni]|uniref:BF3164 family lipoprotein n=1 Tax=Algoriphagus yeomjeoni TaxID=291403 RepID=UPI003CE483D1
MKRSRTFLLLTLILSIWGCTNNKPYTNFDFERNGKPIFQLKGEKVFFPEILNPRKIDQKGEFLIIQESYRISSDKPLIHIIRKNPLSLYSSKGIIGEGPGQISDSDIFDPGLSDSTFWINAVMSKKMSQFNLFDTSRLSIREFRQPENMILAYTVYLTNNGTFIGLMADSPNKLTEFDFDGNRIGGYGEWKQIPERPEMDNFLLSTYNKGKLKSNSAKKVFVKASLYRDRIEIFNYETKSFINIDGPRLELPPATISGSGSNTTLVIPMDQKYGYKDIAVGENLIYALYSGQSQKEIQLTGKDSETVYVLTHEGEMVAKMELDQSIRGIAVDESLGKIYGLTTDEDPGIAVFKIPAVLL